VKRILCHQLPETPKYHKTFVDEYLFLDLVEVL
jgi:hypothetical protein